MDNANPTVNKRTSALAAGKGADAGHESEEALLLRRRLSEFLSEVGAATSLEEEKKGEEDEEPRDGFTASEIFNLIRNIRDPEHPLSLEELNVVSEKGIVVKDEEGVVAIQFTPTVPHCSMSTLIGLCLRVRLLRALPTRFKVDIFVEPGSHVSESQVNKQLNDKERVAAALENTQLLSVVNKCLA